MKNLKFIISSLVVIALFMASCNKNNDDSVLPAVVENGDGNYTLNLNGESINQLYDGIGMVLGELAIPGVASNGDTLMVLVNNVPESGTIEICNNNCDENDGGIWITRGDDEFWVGVSGSITRNGTTKVSANGSLTDLFGGDTISFDLTVENFTLVTFK